MLARTSCDTVLTTREEISVWMWWTRILSPDRVNNQRMKSWMTHVETSCRSIARGWEAVSAVRNVTQCRCFLLVWEWKESKQLRSSSKSNTTSRVSQTRKINQNLHTSGFQRKLRRVTISALPCFLFNLQLKTSGSKVWTWQIGWRFAPNCLFLNCKPQHQIEKTWKAQSVWSAPPWMCVLNGNILDLCSWKAPSKPF